MAEKKRDILALKKYNEDEKHFAKLLEDMSSPALARDAMASIIRRYYNGDISNEKVRYFVSLFNCYVDFVRLGFEAEQLVALQRIEKKIDELMKEKGINE